MLARLIKRGLALFASLFVAHTLLLGLPAEIAHPETLTSMHRMTGADQPACKEYQVCGTDLGIPYMATDGTTKFLFGDTFGTRNPEDQVDWRSPVALWSRTVPGPQNLITFDGAVGANGATPAPELIHNNHRSNGEISVIPNDGISFPETGNEVISYQSIHSWDSSIGDWSTNYAGLAWSPDGVHFYRTGIEWGNDGNNSMPFQMVSMQRDGAFVYLIGVKAGRQKGPMLLMRAPWDQLLDTSTYQCWNGQGWGVGQCRPLFTGTFGEPSFRKLSDGTWALAYLNNVGAIVTRSAANPTGPWSNEKIQLTAQQCPGLYGGFIHPYSTRDNLTLMISAWPKDSNGQTIRYDVSQFNGTLDAVPRIP